ncbi:MAG: hypothetical protein QME76_09190 [Bacillota bacterium]|nr:hypothetical protein [Bacillota bacterium]
MAGGGAAKAAALFIGAVIGAGFASGQEILQFFGVYGTRGIAGALWSAVAFAYLGAVIQLSAVRLRATSYRDVLAYFLGPRLGRLMDTLSTFMLGGGLVVMLAGSGAVLHQQFALPPAAGILLLAALTTAVLYWGLSGVVAVNAVLVPLKILLILLVAFLAGGTAPPAPGGPPPGADGGPEWAWSAVLYVSYNLVVPLAVLSSLGRYLRPGEAVAGAAGAGLALGGTAALVTWAIVQNLPAAASYQVPMLYLAGMVSPVLQSLVSAVVWVAVFTTAIANAHGLASRLARRGSGGYRRLAFIVTFGLAPAAFFPFADLVGLLYPLFGYLGLALILAIAVNPLAGFWRRPPKKFSTGLPGHRR